VVERFAADEQFPPPRRKFSVKYTEKKLDGEPVFLLEPETYMNRNGPAVRELLAYFGGPRATESIAETLLVVHDDLDLPEGRLRFRSDGSSGGHRGVQSLIEALGSGSFARLKVGIGRRAGSEAADYVLERLSREEEAQFLELCVEAARTLPVWIRQGVTACANRFNGVKRDARNEEAE